MDASADVVAVHTELAVDLLDLGRPRNSEWRGRGVDVRLGGIENRSEEAGLGECFPTRSDSHHDRDEGVVGLTIGNAVVVAACGAGPQAISRCQPVGEGRGVNGIDEAVDVVVVADIGRVLDDDVRHPDCLTCVLSSFN